MIPRHLTPEPSGIPDQVPPSTQRGIASPPPLVTRVCVQCCTTFAITETLHEQRRHDWGDVFCPNGHPNHYPVKDCLYYADIEKAARAFVEAQQARFGRTGEVGTLAKVKLGPLGDLMRALGMERPT